LLLRDEMHWNSPGTGPAATLILILVSVAACGSTPPSARPDGDAGADAGGDPSCDHDFANDSCWSTFVSEGLTRNTSDFSGAVFDGTSIVFANRAAGPDGLTVQYPVAAPFAAFSSWVVFDTQMLDAMAYGFGAPAYDGRYVYLPPDLQGTIARYDTKTDLTSRASWSVFSIPGTDAGTAAGFAGAVYDGVGLDLVPSVDGIVIRYEVSGPFDAAASWSSFDIESLPGGRGGFLGAAFDGRYVYFAPHADAAGAHGIVVRYDPSALLSTPSSWTTFDTSAMDGAAGFSGAVFDGRYVYFAPGLASPGGPPSRVTRYDTRAPFDAAAAWSTFDTASLGSGGAPWNYDGAAFDGRYVYFAPASAGVPVLRYDSQAAFPSTTAWATRNLSQGNITGYVGALFDGRYVYLVPAGYSRVTRFDAVTPSAP
jgi:hypothetical protein